MSAPEEAMINRKCEDSNTQCQKETKDGFQIRRRRLEAIYNQLLDALMKDNWGRFIEVCQAHARDSLSARMRRRGKEKFILCCLLHSRSRPPSEAFEAVTEAFPGVATMPLYDGRESLLRDIAKNLHCVNAQRTFKILLKRSQKPNLTSLASALPLPTEIIEEHIMDYCGNALMSEDVTDISLIDSLLGNFRRPPNIVALEALLTAAPGLISVQRGGTEKIHDVLLHNGAPLALLKLLVGACPDILTTKTPSGSTPLWTFLQYSLYWPITCRFETIKLLAGTRPRAVLISCGSQNQLPFEHPYLNDDERQYLEKLTEQQRRALPTRVEKGTHENLDIHDLTVVV